MATIEGKTKLQMYHAAMRLGADRCLLGAIGSWDDTMEDVHVLRDLRTWNAAEWETPSPHVR